MLMRTDPFRELDRLTQQMFGGRGTQARPSVMPMDAWRDGETFVVEFDLPGLSLDGIDLDVERNVITPSRRNVPSCTPTVKPLPPNVRAESSAGNWCSATTWTPTTSTPVTRPAY